MIFRGLAAAVLIAVVGGIALLGGDSDSSTPRAESSSPAPSPSTSASGSSSSSPTETGSTAQPAQGDQAQAMASFADALAQQGSFTREQADCVARRLVDTIGLDQLVDAGFFDADQKFLDPDLGGHPEIKAALTSATVACLT